MTEIAYETGDITVHVEKALMQNIFQLQGEYEPARIPSES
jgi:hypothetical protein